MLVLVREVSLTLLMLVLVKRLSYTPDASFSNRFCYTHHTSFNEEVLLQSS